MLSSFLQLLRKGSVGFSVKSWDILNNSKKSPETHIFLCLSACRAPAKPCPGEHSSPTGPPGPRARTPPQPAQPALDAFGADFFMLLDGIYTNFLPGRHHVLRLLAQSGKASLFQHLRGQNSVGSCLPVYVAIGVQRGVTSPCSPGAIPQQNRGRRRQQEHEAVSPGGFSPAAAHSRSPHSQPRCGSGNSRPMARSRVAVSRDIWSTPGEALC